MIVEVKVDIPPQLLLSPTERAYVERRDDGNLLFSQRSYEDEKAHPLLFSAWLGSEWSVKLIVYKDKPFFELDIPVKSFQQQKLNITLSLRTLALDGGLARRRLGTLSVRMGELEKGNPVKGVFTPMVNAKSIHSQHVGVATLKLVSSEESLPWSLIGDTLFLTAKEATSRVVVRENEFFTKWPMSEEISEIRSETWRTTHGHRPTLFFLWNQDYFQKPVDPSVWENSLLVSMRRLYPNMIQSSFLKMDLKHHLHLLFIMEHNIYFKHPQLNVGGL